MKTMTVPPTLETMFSGHDIVLSTLKRKHIHTSTELALHSVQMLLHSSGLSDRTSFIVRQFELHGAELRDDRVSVPDAAIDTYGSLDATPIELLHFTKIQGKAAFRPIKLIVRLRMDNPGSLTVDDLRQMQFRANTIGEAEELNRLNARLGDLGYHLD